MSEENIAVCRRWWEGLEKGELRLDCCDPEIEIRNVAESPDTGPFHGYDGLRLWWQQIHDPFEHLSLELLDLTEVDDRRLVTEQRWLGRFRHSGLAFDFVWGSVLSMTDARITLAVGYSSYGKAKRAAGLSDA